MPKTFFQKGAMSSDRISIYIQRMEKEGVARTEMDTRLNYKIFYKGDDVKCADSKNAFVSS